MVHGVRHRESCGPDSTRRDAEALLHRRIAEARQGKVYLPAHGRGEILTALLTRYVDDCETRGHRAVRSYRGKVRVIEAHTLGRLPCGLVTTTAVDEYVSQRLGEKRRPAPATVNRELEIVRAGMRWAHHRGEVGEVPRIRLLKQPPGRTRYLTSDEEAAILARCSPRLRAVVLLALHTAARLGEILALRWRDFDPDARMLHLERSAPDGKVGTKDGGRRSVPLNAVAYGLLDGMEKGKPDDLILGPWPNASHAFARAALRAGVRDVREHDLRHTSASRMVLAGVSLRTVADLLGHRTLAMVMRYTHLSPGARREAVDKLVVASDLVTRASAGEGEKHDP